ncbi:MAG: TrmH family RNA methyltransferase [Candidatus Pacebacteria bacterium]|nr:TrmH family RNA methyltransferase [Candidatus Paceibacterota bacterium]
MKDFVVICDSLRSLHNVGSVFRTADGARINKVYLCGITGISDTQKHERQISKVALGAQNYVKWEYVKQSWRLVEKLKKEGYQIVSLEQAPKSINYLKFKPKFPLALIIGNEGKGVKKSLLKRSDYVIDIPMMGQKESLNVSVAFGIAAYWILGFKKIL